MLNDTSILRSLAFLGPKDLAFLAATSKHTRYLAHHDVLWRLQCEGPKGKSGVAVVLERCRFLNEARYYGIAPPTGTMAAAAEERDGGGNWYGFYEATRRERMRRRAAREAWAGDDDGHVIKGPICCWYDAPEMMVMYVRVCL